MATHTPRRSKEERGRGRDGARESEREIYRHIYMYMYARRPIEFGHLLPTAGFVVIYQLC